MTASVWEQGAAAFGLAKGSIILWLSGNDVHSRLAGLGNLDSDNLIQIGIDMRAVILQAAPRGPQEVLVITALQWPGDGDGVGEDGFLPPGTRIEEND